MVTDTSPAAQAHLDALYRRMSVQEKVRRVLGLTEVTHALALGELRRQHPDEDSRALGLRILQRQLDPDVFAQYSAWREAGR